MGNNATGPSSNSFKFAGAGVVTGIGALITTFVQNPSATTNVHAGVAGGVAVLSILGKLFHDHGLNKATLQAGTSDVAKELPAIKSAAQTVLGFAEQDIPGVKSDVSDVTSRVAALEAKIPDLSNIEKIIRSVLGSVPGAAPVPTPAPAPAPTTPPVA